jgi:hypothetical protein
MKITLDQVVRINQRSDKNNDKVLHNSLTCGFGWGSLSIFAPPNRNGNTDSHNASKLA